MTAPLTTRPRLNAIVFTILLEELVSGPSNLHTLCEVSGLEKKTVRKVLKAMYDRKLIHLKAYEADRRGSFVVPLWAFGPGKDAERKIKTRAQVCKTYRQRKAMEQMTAAMAMQPAANDTSRRDAA